jgi:hypothetical protein
VQTTPRTDAEAKRLAKGGSLPPGHYDGEITQAVETTSKRGNPMIEATIMIQDAEGQKRAITDYLLDTPLGALKLLHAVEAVGAGARYRAGEIEASDFEGRTVRVKIIVAKQKGFRDTVKVEDYAPVQPRAEGNGNA